MTRTSRRRFLAALGSAAAAGTAGCGAIGDLAGGVRRRGPPGTPVGGGEGGRWPMFRAGPRNLGTRPDAAAPPPETQLDWYVETGRFTTSSPAVADGMAYVGTVEGTLLALSSAYRGVGWRVRTRGAVHSSPAVAGGAVVVGTDEGYVVCRDRRDGALRWRAQTGGPVWSSPTVAGGPDDTGDPPATPDGGTVYVGSDDGSVYALALADGRVRWRAMVGETGPDRETPFVVRTTPAVTADRVYVGTFGGEVVALSRADGRVRWRTSLPRAVYASPAVAGGRVFVGTHDARTGYEEGSVHALDAPTGTERWSYAAGDRVFSSPAVAGTGDAGPAIVVVGADDRQVHALRAADGAVRWRERVSGRIRASPAVVDVARTGAGAPDGTVVVSTGAGNTHGFALADGTRRFRVRTRPGGAASPAVADARVFVPTLDGTLYVLSSRRAPSTGSARS